MKERLQQLHDLDINQRVDSLLDMPVLQGQKPSDKRQLCPTGEDKPTFFRRMFVRRLPEKVKLMLTEDHSSTIAELAARADKLVTATSKVAATVATILEDTIVVAAATAPSRLTIRASGGEAFPTVATGSGNGIDAEHRRQDSILFKNSTSAVQYG